MRNHDGGSTSSQAAKVILNRAFGLGVERARRFVKNEDRRVVVDGARDRDALLLSARK